MKLTTLAFAALAVPALLSTSPARAYDMPYDPYPWCAVYSGDAGGASNCGFLTIDQCRATVSGIGGFVRAQSILQSAAGDARPQAQVAGIDCPH